jgi:hypothetical protein
VTPPSAPRERWTIYVCEEHPDALAVCPLTDDLPWCPIRATSHKMRPVEVLPASYAQELAQAASAYLYASVGKGYRHGSGAKEYRLRQALSRLHPDKEDRHKEGSE